MDDFRENQQAFDPPAAPKREYSADAAKEAVFSSEDVYSMGRLPGYEESSMFIQLLKAIGGALIGAIPGILLWIIVGRIGFVAIICGGILALGVVAGYTFMSKDGALPEIYGIVVCVAIIIISVFLAEKVVWCWKMADMFPRIINEIKEPLYALGEVGGVSHESVDEIVKNNLEEGLGFSYCTLSNFFFNFSRSLKYFGVTGSYYFNLLLSYAFAAAGAFWMFKKANR